MYNFCRNTTDDLLHIYCQFNMWACSLRVVIIKGPTHRCVNLFPLVRCPLCGHDWRLPHSSVLLISSAPRSKSCPSSRQAFPSGQLKHSFNVHFIPPAGDLLRARPHDAPQFCDYIIRVVPFVLNNPYEIVLHMYFHSAGKCTAHVTTQVGEMRVGGKDIMEPDIQMEQDLLCTSRRCFGSCHLIVFTYLDAIVPWLFVGVYNFI